MKENNSVDQKDYKTLYRRYKKATKILSISLVIILSLSGTYFYLNFDYFVLKHMIAQNYIYTDTLDKLYEDTLGFDVRGQYYKYFDNIAISTVTDKIRKIDGDRYTYQYVPQAYESYKVQKKSTGESSTYKIVDNDILYVQLTNFSEYTEAFFNDNKEEFAKYPYLILDLRNNYGGDTDALYNMCDLFLPKGDVMSTDKMRIPLFTKVVKSKSDAYFDFKKIVILQNKNSASSAENMIVALKDNLPNVTLVGTTTFGKGIGQTTLDLKRGFALKATTMLWYTPNGENIQGHGIKPDVYEDNVMNQFLKAKEIIKQEKE